MRLFGGIIRAVPILSLVLLVLHVVLPMTARVSAALADARQMMRRGAGRRASVGRRAVSVGGLLVFRIAS